jgi:uncharacterized protein (TIGR02594 family)
MTRDIQRALSAAGFDPGPIDGIMGRKTISAIAAFQKARNVAVKWPGTVGSKTLAALGLLDKPSPSWMTEAHRYLGLHETKNAKRLDAILKMNTRSIPWCGAFVGMVIAQTLPKEPLPDNPLWARNWLKFGTKLDEPYSGAIAVFERGSGGHVGFVNGHDKTYLHILGGNQSNSVSVAKISKSRLLGYRWPTTSSLIGSPLQHTAFNGNVTTNEA